ncbi:MAG TPA: hypothetical protein VNI83_02245 [Vicinamibacterales bacterium]|nr:hypothetical protein [Vicinamibacterales bacterium]
MRRRSGPNQDRFVGPGQKLILRSPDGLVVFAWRKAQYRLDGQTGVECVLFRNESSRLSSALILEAVALAAGRWPGERLFTYCTATVDRAGRLIRYGRCFLEAGWRLIDARGWRFLWELTP